MAANDDKIALTIRIQNELYYRLHKYTEKIGATHNGVVRVLIEDFLDNKCGCSSQRRAAPHDAK